MTKTTISKVKDGNQFCLSKRSKIIYDLITKRKGKATFTSTSSTRSYIRSVNTVCYV